MSTDWTHCGELVDTAPPEFVGFVYLIIEKSTGKMYVGKKLWWGKRGKKKVESDWKNYFGSSRQLHEALEANGKENYNRVILHKCKTRSEMSYLEIKEQIDRRVLFDDTYYNAFIGCKVNAAGVKHLK